jgi:hypothetical protein
MLITRVQKVFYSMTYLFESYAFKRKLECVEKSRLLKLQNEKTNTLILNIYKELLKADLIRNFLILHISHCYRV